MAAVRFLKLEHTEVAIDSIKPHPENPRQGDVGAIAQSIDKHGFYGEVLVQRSTGFIIAGSHRWKALKAKGAKKAPAAIADLDDDEAKAIMLDDNRANDLATYDDTVLTKLLQEFQDKGTLADRTLYTGDDLDARLASARTPLKLDSGQANARDVWARPSVTPAAADTFDRTDPPPGMNPDNDKVAELQQALTAREENRWAGKNWWGVADLRDDMLVESVALPMRTWAGDEVSVDDGVTTWLYNYGTCSPRGLPWGRTWLSFFTHDEAFEGWWQQPGFYTAKAVSSGLKMAVVPDFSFYYTEPRVVHLYNVYRAQWLGRFFQEAGVRVIPRLQVDHRDPETLKVAMFGIPRGLPVLISSMQNYETKEDEEKGVAVLQAALNELKPLTFIGYGGEPAKRVLEGLKTDAKLVHVINYAAERRGKAFHKEEGLGTKKAAQAKRKKGGDSDG